MILSLLIYTFAQLPILCCCFFFVLLISFLPAVFPAFGNCDCIAFGLDYKFYFFIFV